MAHYMNATPAAPAPQQDIPAPEPVAAPEPQPEPEIVSVSASVCTQTDPPPRTLEICAARNNHDGTIVVDIALPDGLPASAKAIMVVIKK